MIYSIAKFEFKSLTKSHIFWTSYAGATLVLAYLFFGYLDSFINYWQHKSSVSDAIISPIFGDAAVVSLLMIPLVACKSLSSESSYSPLTLLITSPASMTQIILGKFFGCLCYVLPLFIFINFMCLSIAFGTEFDYLRLASSSIGLLGVQIFLLAISLLFSALLNNTMAALMSTYGLVMLLWILDWSVSGSDAAGGVISYLAIMPHFEAPRRGWLTTQDLLYFVISTVAMLCITIQLFQSRYKASK